MVGGVTRSVLNQLCGILVILIFLSVSTALTPGGRHVISKYEVYYVTEQYLSKVTSSYQTCRKTGWWLGSSRRCSTVYYYKWVTKSRVVKKTRTVYVCESGYKEYNDECQPDCGTYGCRHGGTCVSPGKCSCSSDWKGDKCETDVNECSYFYKHRCAHKCKNTQGSFYCKCRTGFRLSSNHRSCEDINECRPSNPCGRGTCINTQGSYRCSCKPGFINNGGYCTDINECNGYHGCQGTCHNTDGSYECSCPDGTSMHQDQRTCTDIDECKSSHGCEYKCVNFHGSYKCICENGYETNSRRPKSCTDIDECSRGTSDCLQQCTNSIGSFTCSCRTGYVLAWDKRTCNDVNECNQNRGCIHNCVNTIGSYHCSCRPGFDLNSDKRTCQGRPCRPIYVPPKAKKHCNGYTTESVCTFTCITGYEIKTSPFEHICLPSKDWSGTEPVCSPIDCEFPRAPVNGFIYDSCYTTFKSECQLGCDDGFFSNGNLIIKCGALKKWEPENITCIKSAICDQKSCLRNGVCSLVGVDKFICNCTATGYKGNRCEIGEISTPEYEVMKTGQTTDQLEFLASTPSKEVIVTPVSEGIRFDPPSLIFTPENGAIKVKRFTRVTTYGESGVFQVRYAVSGASSEDYYPVQPDLIVVYSKPNEDNEIDLKKLHGCHQIPIYKCPGEDNYITAGSTSPWATYDENHITAGIVRIQSQLINVPLSISGASFPKLQAETNNLKYLAPQSCDSFPPKQIPIVQLINSRAQENSYLNAIQTKLPNWIKLELPNDGNLKSLASYQLGSTFLNGRKLKDRLGGYENGLIDNNIYSTQFVSSQSKLKIGEEIVEFPRYGKSIPITVATSLCSGNGSTEITLIALPPQSLNLIGELNVLKRSRQSGWDILPISLMIANDLQTPSQTYYNGIDRADYKISNANMALQLEIKKKVAENEFFNSTFRFDGTATAQVFNVNKILDNGFKDLVKVSLDGKTSVQLDLNILGNSTQVKLESDKSSSYMDLGESTKTNKTKMLVNFILQEDPFRSSLLDNFLEIEKSRKVSISIDVPLNTSHLGNSLEQMSFQFHGKLKDGALRIPDLNVQMHITQPKSSQRGEIQIIGKGKQRSIDNLGKIFKKFEDLPLEVNITIPSNGTNINTVFKGTVEILGMLDTVIFHFSKGYITWENEGNIFNKYKVKYNAKMNVEDKTLAIDGFMQHGSESLYNSLSEGATKIAINAYNKATKRLDGAKNSEKNYLQKLHETARLYEQAKKNVNDAQNRLNLAKENVAKIGNELKTWETSAKDSSGTLFRLREKMSKLCTVKICDPICKVGTVCSTCYDYIEESVKGECIGTCYKSFQRRVLPFSKIDICSRQECSYLRRRSGFLGFLGILIKFTAFSILSIFVPPPIALGIVNAGETFIETRNLNTALCTFAKTTITGGIQNLKLKTTTKVVSNVISCGRTPVMRYGRWKCYYHIVQCEKGVFNYEYDHTPYTCTRPCQKNVVTERIPYQCCGRDECAIEVPDTRCVIQNSQCQRIRDEALSKVDESERATAAVIKDYDKKRKQHFEQVIELAKAKLKTRSTKTKLQSWKELLEIFKRAYDNSKLAREVLENKLSPILKLDAPIKTNEKFINIEKIGFSTKQDHHLLPIDIYFGFSGGTQGLLRTVLDFNNLNRSEQSIYKEIVENLFGDISHLDRRRRRRSADTDEREVDENISSLKKYNKLCSSFTNSLKILREAFSTLNNLVSAHLNNITNTETTPTVERSFSPMTDEDNALIDRIEEVFNISSALNKDQMKIESNNFYTKWHATMENILNKTATDCSGFEDCLNNAISNIFDLFDDFYTNKSHRVFGILKGMDKRLENILSFSLEMSAIDAFNMSNYTLYLVTKLSQEDVFCIQAINITHHPPTMIELSIGQDLVLICNATGYGPLFGWQFNGTVLQGQSSSVLKMKSVTRCNQGFYRCVVSNHRSTEKSLPTFLIVKTPPKITKHPVQYLDPKIGTTAYLDCKGESSDLKSMNYSWIYQSVVSSKYTALPNQNYPVMGIHNVSSENRGRYICTVSNSYGTTKSRSTFLDPLEYSLPVPALTLVFSIESFINDLGQLKNTYSKVAELLQSFLQEKVKSVAGSDTAYVEKPRVTSGRLHPKADNTTSLLVSEWQAQLKNTKISDDRVTEDDNSAVQNASDHLQATYKKLSNYMNSKKRYISAGNSKHSLLPKTFGVTKLVMECSKGQSYDQHYLSCVNCPSGSHSAVDNDNLTMCQPCVIATYQPNQGKISCISCSGDLTTPTKGSRRQENCIVICDMGHYVEVSDGHGECRQCPKNTYQPLTGQSTCLPCPCSFVTNGTGKTKEKDCELANDSEITKPENRNGLDMVVIYAPIIACVCIIGFVTAICYYKKRHTGPHQTRARAETVHQNDVNNECFATENPRISIPINNLPQTSKKETEIPPEDYHRKYESVPGNLQQLDTNLLKDYNVNVPNENVNRREKKVDNRESDANNRKRDVNNREGNADNREHDVGNVEQNMNDRRIINSRDYDSAMFNVHPDGQEPIQSRPGEQLREGVGPHDGQDFKTLQEEYNSKFNQP